MTKLQLFKIPGTISEHRKALETNAETRRVIIKQEYDAKMKRYAEMWELTIKRVVDLKNHRESEKSKKIEKNLAHIEKIQFRLEEIKNFEFYKKLGLIAKFKNRDQKQAAKRENVKRSTLAKRQEKEVKRYLAKFDEQTWFIENNKTLVDKCIENKEIDESVVEEIIDEINEEIEIEAESSLHCDFTHVSDNPGFAPEWFTRFCVLNVLGCV